MDGFNALEVKWKQEYQIGFAMEEEIDGVYGLEELPADQQLDHDHVSFA